MADSQDRVKAIVAAWAPVTAVLAAILFVVGRLWLTLYFGRVELSPEDAGLGQSSILIIVAPIGLAVALIASVLLLGWVVMRSANTYLDRSADELRSDLEELNREEASFWQKTVVRLKLFLLDPQLFSVSVVNRHLFGSWFRLVVLVLLLFASTIYMPYRAGGDVASGELSTAPVRILSIFLPQAPRCVTASWLDPPTGDAARELLDDGGEHVVHLATASGQVLLRRPGLGQSGSTLRLDSGLVALSSTNAKNCTAG